MAVWASRLVERPPQCSEMIEVKSALHDLAGLTRTINGCYHQPAGWSSLVARWAHNPKVGGSNPPPATNSKTFKLRSLRGFLLRHAFPDFGSIRSNNEIESNFASSQTAIFKLLVSM